MTVPALHLVLNIEDLAPRLFLEAFSEGEEVRLVDWLEASPKACELLELVERWREAA